MMSTIYRHEDRREGTRAGSPERHVKDASLPCLLHAYRMTGACAARAGMQFVPLSRKARHRITRRQKRIDML